MALIFAAFLWLVSLRRGQRIGSPIALAKLRGGYLKSASEKTLGTGLRDARLVGQSDEWRVEFFFVWFPICHDMWTRYCRGRAQRRRRKRKRGSEEMGFYKSSSSSTEGSVQTTPPQPGNSLMWGDSALYERVEHVQEQEEPQQDHTQIPSQSFVGLGRSLSLSASSVLNSVTSNASNLLTGGSNGFPCPTPKAAHAPKEGSSVGEEKDEDEDDFEKVRREDAFPPPPLSARGWVQSWTPPWAIY
ncbi:hypothetical protein Naga_100268g5 [Nannochloropsis gaditana]|uniref:Uncharacterized protein n=1 Tax=Nannochloropsis gaditana TaxID=72520 RepID=W7U104_9STRA|nr:hypothetical protein Naga_100268g5 [Nannochloropsis gaditana]